MFDDIPLKNQGTVPSNLPVAEPEDMLASADRETDAPAPAPSALSAGILQPKAAPAQGSAPAPAPAPPMASPIRSPEPAQQGGDATRFRTPAPFSAPAPTPAPAPSVIEVNQGSSVGHIALTAAIILVIVAVFGVGGWYVYSHYIVGSKTQPAPVTAKTTGQPVTTGNNTQPSTGSSTVPSGSDQLLFGSEVDSDADGLSDTREIQIGTDPHNWDTDGDGLSDYNEVVVWKTDPHNPDTDGDGFKDGQEVTNGYNPAGPGKIFQPPSSTPDIAR